MHHRTGGQRPPDHLCGRRSPARWRSTIFSYRPQAGRAPFVSVCRRRLLREHIEVEVALVIRLIVVALYPELFVMTPLLLIEPDIKSVLVRQVLQLPVYLRARLLVGARYALLDQLI